MTPFFERALCDIPIKDERFGFTDRSRLLFPMQGGEVGEAPMRIGSTMSGIPPTCTRTNLPCFQDDHFGRMILGFQQTVGNHSSYAHNQFPFELDQARATRCSLPHIPLPTITTSASSGSGSSLLLFNSGCSRTVLCHSERTPSGGGRCLCVAGPVAMGIVTSCLHNKLNSVDVSGIRIALRTYTYRRR